MADFEVLGQLGEGSYSQVVLARIRAGSPPGAAGEVALKVMDKFLVLREKRLDAVKLERDVLDELTHPGVARLLFSFQDARSLYLGMGALRGGELYDRIGAGMGVAEAREALSQVVEVVDYLRGRGVVHRDLKPENLVYGDHGRLVLCDFGSCLRLADQAEGRPPALEGTAEYVAVECLDKGPVTPAYDLWGVGCLLYQMLVGRPPFREATEYLTLLKIKELDFDVPASVDPDAADLIRGLLQRDPMQRPGARDMDELRRHPFFRGVDWGAVYPEEPAEETPP